VLHELWEEPEGDYPYTFCLAGSRGDAARALLSSAARRTWTVEAASHFEAMTKYYEHQEWGTYTTDQAWDMKSYAEHGWE
jgi:hypothetical protein